MGIVGIDLIRFEDRLTDVFDILPVVNDGDS